MQKLLNAVEKQRKLMAEAADYIWKNPEKTCVTSAKWQVVMIYELLKNGGERAKQIKAEYKPRFESIKAYLDFMDSLDRDGDRIVYTDGKAEVRI